MEDHLLALRLAAKSGGEVEVGGADAVLAEQRAGDLGERIGDRHQRALRVAADRAAVLGEVVGRVDLLVVAAVAGDDQSLAWRAPERRALTHLGHPLDFVLVSHPIPPRPRAYPSASSDHRQALADADAERREAITAAARRSARVTVRPTTRAPEAPSGWPIAIAPPLMLTFAGSRSGQPLRQASDCEAKASFSSTASTSSQVDAGLRQRLVRGLDRGDAEDVGVDPVDAAGDDPGQRRAADRVAPPPSEPSSSIEAPSFSGEELPAVTVPPSTKAGFSFAELLQRRCRRGCPRRARGRRRGPGRPRAKRPSSQAAAASGVAAQRRTRPAPRARCS